MLSNKKFFTLLLLILNLSSCTLNTKSTQSRKSTQITKKHRLKPASLAPKLSQLKYSSASVLLYYTDSHGTKKVILADEAGGWDRGTFCDFGGKRSRGETHPVQTAAHELYEEAIIPTVFGWSLRQTQDFIDIAKANNTQLINVYSSKKMCHVTYLTDFTQYRDTFFKQFPIARKHATKHQFREKNKLAIVTWQELKDAVTQQRKSWFTKNQPVKLSALVQNRHTGRFNTERITLRPSFVISLRPFFLNKSYIQGWDKKIRFYNE